jgi:enoyl-CoA hydratase/carnithine racemase
VQADVLPGSSAASASLSTDARGFRELLADPGAAESVSAAAGCPLVVVEIADGSAGAALAELDVTALPAVVAGVVRDPGCLPRSAHAACDVLLTEDAAADRPFAAPAGGLQAGLAALDAAVSANPVAATTLALLLRSTAGLSAPAALVAESAAYSALQDGAEFRRWRAGRPVRPPEPALERIRLELAGRDLRIVLARPTRRNAVDLRMRDALAEALATAARDQYLQVELAGDGPDFCSGGDLDEFGSRPDPAQAHIVRLTRSPALLLHRLADRTTAQLHGSCLGAGIEWPAFAGRVVAAADTRIALPEIGLGLIPGAGGTVSLTRRIGRWRTAFLALSGTYLTAADALAWGLVDAVGLVDAAELVDAVEPVDP